MLHTLSITEKRADRWVHSHTQATASSKSSNVLTGFRRGSRVKYILIVLSERYSDNSTSFFKLFFAFLLTKTLIGSEVCANVLVGISENSICICSSMSSLTLLLTVSVAKFQTECHIESDTSNQTMLLILFMNLFFTFQASLFHPTQRSSRFVLLLGKHVSLNYTL
jgi:hypothetical protein